MSSLWRHRLDSTYGVVRVRCYLAGSGLLSNSPLRHLCYRRTICTHSGRRNPNLWS